jgi:hypothetical protein
MNSPILYFFMGIAFVWGLSYFYNYQISRSKLNKIARWLNEGLWVLGGKPTSRWQGSNTLRILLNGGRGVISDGAIVLGIQSKELAKALLSIMRGGRDSMNFVFTLTTPPQVANCFEIFEASGPLPRVIMLNVSGEWMVEPASTGAYRIAYLNNTGRESAIRLLTLFNDYGLDIRRISVRTEAPHLLLTFNLHGQIKVEARELLSTIRNLAEEAVHSGNSTSLQPPTKKSPNNGNKTKSIRPLNRPTERKVPTLKAKEPSESDPLTPRFGPQLSPYYEPTITKNYNSNLVLGKY